MNLRTVHRKIAPILFIPLGLSAISGMACRLGRSWFNLPAELCAAMMTFHEGRYLGAALTPVYILLVGLGLVGLIVSGLSLYTAHLARRQGRGSFAGVSSPFNSRFLHRLLAPIIFLPLAISALSGMAYRLGRNWLGVSVDHAQWLMALHQGSYFGPGGQAIYVFLVGLGLIGAIATGIQMTGLFRARAPHRSNTP